MAKSALTEYSAKRTFATTPEPPPAVPAPGSGPLLFVVQQHSATRLHYDFRLECDGVLKSWAVPKGPSLDRSEKRLAVQTEDHPYDYASFEGVIPPGQYGAGEVIVWDCGVYSPDEGDTTWFHDRAQAEREVRQGLEQGKLSVLLRGEKLKGSFALVRTKEKNQWLLIKHKDRFAVSEDVTLKNQSVLSGKTVGELKFLPVTRMAADKLAPTGKVEAMPATLAPMLAESGDAPFHRPDWMWEPKLDGYRVLAFVDEHGVKLRSRRGLELAGKFPRLVTELGQQAVRSMILDGELVAFDASGRPSFGALQDRAQLKTERDIAAAELNMPVVFYCFDLLHFAGVDLRKATYLDRRRYLAQCLLPSPPVQLVHAAEDGIELQAAALASGFEGVVGKRKESRYEAGRRSTSWVKVKPTVSADFVVGGYTTGKGSRTPLGSLLVGYWDKGKLHYASHVGSGFDERALAQVKARLAPAQAQHLSLRREAGAERADDVGRARSRRRSELPELDRRRSPAGTGLPAAARRRRSAGRAALRPWPRAARARPPRAARSTTSWRSSRARRPRSRSRWDRTGSASRTSIASTGPRIRRGSSAAFTKRDLLVYFAQVSPYILPHLADRPLTMIRMPDGIRGQRFFQKHWEQERPDVRRDDHRVLGTRRTSRTTTCCATTCRRCCGSRSPGTLEFHVWHSRAKPGADAASKSTDYATSLASLEASVLNYPDYVLFDLDPYIYSGKEAKGAEPELNTSPSKRARKSRSGCASSCRACRSSPSSRPRARRVSTCSSRSSARSISTPPAMCRSWSAGT